MNIKKELLNNVYKIIGYAKSLSYNPRNSIIISGSPRSGTTWLAEILTSIPKICLLWEPLHLTHQKDLNKCKELTWRTIIDKEYKNNKLEKLFKDLLTGKRLNTHLISRSSINKFITADHLVLKFVRANGILEWLGKNFDVMTPCVIVRHPCAVVSSQMHRRTKHKTITKEVTLKEWRNGPPDYVIHFIEKHPKFKNIINSLNEWEEILAAIWCMDNFHILLKDTKPFCIVLPYEKLVKEGKYILTNLLDLYKIDYTNEVFKKLNQESSTVVKGSNVLTGKDPLATWKSMLSENQTRMILSIVKNFGYRCYTENLEPDYKYLNSRSVLKF